MGLKAMSNSRKLDRLPHVALVFLDCKNKDFKEGLNGMLHEEM